MNETTFKRITETPCKNGESIHGNIGEIVGSAKTPYEKVVALDNFIGEIIEEIEGEKQKIATPATPAFVCGDCTDYSVGLVQLCECSLEGADPKTCLIDGHPCNWVKPD
jgi:hypothetical protein